MRSDTNIEGDHRCHECESYEREVKALKSKLDESSEKNRIVAGQCIELMKQKSRLDLEWKNNIELHDKLLAAEGRLGAIRSQLDEWDASVAGVGFGNGRATLRQLLDGAVETEPGRRPGSSPEG